jgi:Fe-S cluster assembly protein SufB
MRKNTEILSRDVVIELSSKKKEPSWVCDMRLKALDVFYSLSIPSWAPDVSSVFKKDLSWYVTPTEPLYASWQDVPEHIKLKFERLGIPDIERNVLSGLGLQFESEMIFHSVKSELQEQGVLFLDWQTALHDYSDLVKRYFGTVVNCDNNIFAALNGALWSGGNFVYIPEGVVVSQPIQAYFQIMVEAMGQFERTLIIAEPKSFIHYVEGCSAPVLRRNSLHCGVVELIAHKDAHIRYSTIQNWSNNVYNLVTKRAHAYSNAKIEWIDGNFGSALTMKYPTVVLKESGARGQLVSVAVAGAQQTQDSGGTMIHEASDTSSSIISKSWCKSGGVSIFRGTISVPEGLSQIKSFMKCDSLVQDTASKVEGYPLLDVHSSDVQVGHEATVSKIPDEQMRYLMSRGIVAQRSRALIINGFIDCFVKELPLEYAIEINRLIAFEVEVEGDEL